MITSRVGQQFQITLDSNPTTGYQWRFSEDPDGVVKLVKHDYSPSPPQRIGSGGFDHWVFEGVETGETTITFEYLRAWETGVEPDHIVRYNVMVLADRSSDLMSEP